MVSFALSYCPNGTDVLTGLRKLYQARSQDIILARMNIPSRTLAEFSKKLKRELTRLREDYDDDSDVAVKSKQWQQEMRQGAVGCSAVARRSSCRS